MPIELFAHPFSSYCQKALIAFYENDVPFNYRMMEDPGVGEELAALWPMKRFPILRENGRTVIEATIIIEHLQIRALSGSSPMMQNSRSRRGCSTASSTIT